MTQILRGAAAAAAGADDTPGNWAPRRTSNGQDLLEAARLMQRAFGGNRRAMLDLQEALTTSDFRNTVFEVLDREMLSRYQDIPPVWQQYARRTTVRDFKAKKFYDLMGGKAALDRVPEVTEYPAREVSRGIYELTVGKYGGRFAISWEAMINDELEELRDLPGALAAAARDTESRTAASLLTDGNGPNTGLFSATAYGRTYDESTNTWSGGSSNLLAGNPALSVNAVTAALAAVGQRRDPDGRPIVVQSYVLVVPPALEVTARKILDATEIRETSGGQEVVQRNWLAGRIKLVVDPWLPVIDLGANAATTWYLLPDPNSSRPAVVLAFLRGHETPDLRVKADTGQRVGGGAIPATEGSFDIDDIQYRVRHVVGGTSLDAIATAYSNGSGS